MARQTSDVPHAGLPPLAVWLQDKPTWFRLVVLIPLISVGLGFLFGFPGYYAWKALASVPAKATVAECETTRRGAVCRGSWVTEEGERGSGSIDGVYGSDVGSTVDVWVAGDSATTAPPWSMGMIPGLFAVSFIIAGVFIVKAIRNARKHPDGPPTKAKAWQPPKEFPPRQEPALYAAPTVEVTWHPRGFDGGVSFEYSVAGAGVVARASEPDLSVGRRIWRFIDYTPGDQRHRVVCQDPDGNPLFTVDKPKQRSPFSHPTATVYGPTGLTVGTMRQLSHNPFKRRFECHDASGSRLATVAQPSIASQSYRVTDRHGAEVARLVHGIDQRPVRVDGSYRFLVELRHRPAEPMHTMVLAAVVLVQLLTAEV